MEEEEEEEEWQELDGWIDRSLRVKVGHEEERFEVEVWLTKVSHYGFLAIRFPPPPPRLAAGLKLSLNDTSFIAGHRSSWQQSRQASRRRVGPRPRRVASSSIPALTSQLVILNSNNND